MVRRMQITNAAERLAARLEEKARRSWNPDLHPRDSKGRFIETGGIARLWGGGLARVMRSLGGRNVLVENLATHQQSTIHASRLTMVARPDGSAPTKSKKKVRDEDERRGADGRRGTGLDGEDTGDQGDTPDDPHDQDDQGEDIGEDVDGEDHGDGPEPDDDEPDDDAKAESTQKRVRRDPNRRYKTLDDVRAHWASGKLRPFVTDEKRHAAHSGAMRSYMEELDKPQLSRNGQFTVGKLPAKKPSDGPYGWAVTHNDTGMRMVTTSRKAEALDFANRMETAEFDGKPIDWDDPAAFDIFRTADGRALANNLAAESRKAFAERASKKKEGATARTTPAAPTASPEQRAAQQVAARTGVPARNVAVGHVGGPAPASGAAPQGRPRNDAELREFWKRGGANANARKHTRKVQADALRQLANDPNLRIALASHHGFAIVEDTSRDDAYRFRLLTSGAGRRLAGLGPGGIHEYGKFSDRETADRFALYLGSNLRDKDDRTLDWGDPNVAVALSAFRDKNGQPARDAIWQLAGQFDRERGTTDSPAARSGRRHDKPSEEQRQNPETAPETPTTGIPGEDVTPQPAEGQSNNQEEQQSERVQGAGEGVLGDVPAGRAGEGGGDDAGRDVVRAGERGDRGTDRGVPGRLPGDAGAGSGLQGRDGVDQHGNDAGQGEGPAREAVQPGEGARDGGQGDADGEPAEDRSRVTFGSTEQEQTAPQYQPPEDGRPVVPSGVPARVKANIAAIEVLRRLQDENRPATAAEQETLARWSGWGATPQVFVDTPKPEFEPLQRRLRELLSDSEYEAAKDNTLNAHYTDPAIAQQVWKAVRELGFDGGNVLEPGSGSGNFIGHAPENTEMTGVELDPITAGIAKALYPHANIRNEGFEKTRAANGTFDLTVGNVPFGDYQVVDMRHNKGGHNIHNHFILKSLDLTRPGGLVAVVTSRYTMDGNTPRSEDARMEMARKADLVGAIRLPTGAHRRTAGTDVVTDLLIFRRREKDKEFTSGRTRNGDVKPAEQRKQDDPPTWVHSVQVHDLPGQDPEDKEAPKVSVNPYFLDHPRNVVGDMHVGAGMYGPGELRVRAAGDLNEELGHTLKRVVGRAKDARLTYKPDTGERRKVELLSAESDRPDGHVQVESDGAFSQVRDGMVHPHDIPKPQIEEAKQLLTLRDSLKALVREESRPDADEALIETLRADLNARYDTYNGKFGSINRFEWAKRKATDSETGAQIEKAYRKRPPMGGLLTKDPTMAVILSLDTYDETTKTSTPAAIFSKRQARHRTIAERASRPEDAMAVVLEQRGTLDVDALADVMGTSPETARERLLAARSKDPETGEEYPLVFEPHDRGNLVPAAEYLSGNVREKLEEAQALAGNDSRFEINVKHLEDVLPEEISPGEIDAPMGAAWLGRGPIQAFLRDKLNTDSVKVGFQGGSLWRVEAPDVVKNGQAARKVWGTPDFNAVKLAEAILTNGRIRVTYRGDDGKTYLDEDATAAAQTKAEEMREEFQDWLWATQERTEQVKKRYNDLHNNLALRSYDGQRRTMPGLAEWFKPHAHQHSAVARMVSEPAVLLAHEVGAGKTAEMAMGVMELRRLGLVNKAAVVVPNHMLNQFRDEFAELYPESASNGRILAASSDDLQGRKRREFIARVATGDYDAVILTQNAFESIPMRPEVQLEYIQREKEQLEEALKRQKQEDQEGSPGKRSDSRMVKEIRNRLKKLEAKITAKVEAQKDTAGLYFEDTGIDYVVVDEAHHYKNLTTNSTLPGAAIEGSNRASDLDMKLEYLRKTTKSGRVVTFATATPISNSITEVHTMLRYLRPDLLEKAKIRNFDDFASTYGKVVNGTELAADGSGFREVSRFAAFRNMPELLRIWRTVADVKNADDLAEYLDTPDVAGGKAVTVSVEATDGLLEYMDRIAARARAVKAGQVEPTVDNMLKINSDGRKVSLDPRMVGIDEQGAKLPAAADNIARIYTDTKDAVYPTSKNNPTPHETPGGLQIVFLDMGTPVDPGKAKKKKGKAEGPADMEELGQSKFPAYQELKELLIERGVPAEKIRFIHEAKNDVEKSRLFADARNGKIAVLLGSTTKMGVGTNVQLRATALHHLDCPWRPADLEQRNGRIIRQGNFNPEVAIFQYVTEGSFDGFSWQTVARKAKFIRQLMKGNLTERTIEDIPDGVFNAEQVTAISTGNPYLLEQANIKVALGTLTRKRKGHMRTIEGYKSTIHAAERLREMTNELTAQLNDVAKRKKNTRGDDFNATIGTKDFTKRDEAAKALATAARAVLQQGTEDPYRSGGHREVVIGKVGNIDVTAQYRTTWGNVSRVHLVDIRIPDVPQSRFSYDEKDLKRESTLPITRIEDKLADVDKMIVRLESRLRQEERAAATARERVDRPFEQADELESAERRSKLIGAIIKEQGREVSSEDGAKDKRNRMEALEHQLREARLAAGEDAADVDDPAAEQDTDLLPRTPAAPSITTDAKGQTRVTWPDAEARKAAKERKRREKQQRAREERGETTLNPEQVRSDLDGLSEDAPAANNDEQGQDEGQSDAPASEADTSGSTGGDVTLNPEQVRSELDGLQPEDSESDETEPTVDEAPRPDAVDESEQDAANLDAPESESARPEPEPERGQETPTGEEEQSEPNDADGDAETEATDEQPEGTEGTEVPNTSEEPEAAADASANSEATDTPADTADSDTPSNASRRPRTSGAGGTRESGAPRMPRPAGKRERPAPAARPQPASQPAAADMNEEQLDDAIDEVGDRISPLAESTDPLDLAMRRRLERRQWELEDEERRRWKPEPKYDENGKLVQPSRGDTISDRLGGYGLNDGEVQGLVTRVEDLPEAKEGGFPDDEWERIDADASAREDYPPTGEQNIIIQGAARRGLNMAVMALAGTGKSSTLKMLSHRMPGKKIVYLAFNRSVAAEAREAQARGEYAKNMLASTANAYAARVADPRMNDRLPSSRAGGFKKLSAQQIADRMRWYDTVKAGNRDLVPGGAATVAERMIREWAKSADAEMGPQHVRAKTEEERRDLFNAVKPLADRMWANLSDPEAGNPDSDLTMDFDYIVKQWALGGYKIDADTLFWDEAQDVNPVMEGVVRAALDQGVQVVAVGDSNQAIYGFRGASDALAKLPVDARATLTQSFRFGPAVADVGNRFLRLLGTRMRLKGFDRKDSHIGELHPGDESMVIARTNAGVALAAVQALTAGRTVAVSGGVKALQEFVQGAHALAEGEDTDHAELARFNGMAFDDIVEEVKADPDLQQLASLFNLLEKHGDDIDALLMSGSRPAATDLVGDRVWVRLDWNDPNASDLKRWLGDGKNNGVGKLLYDPATRRYYYEPGKRSVPWKSKTRSGVHKIDNKLSLEEAQQRIDAHLAMMYPQDDAGDGNGRLVPEHEPHDVLVTTAHKAKGLESERVRIADDFKGPEDDDDGNIDWDTVPDDEALRVAYVAVTRATEVLDPGSLGWVFRAVNDDDPTQPPKGEYRRDFKLDDFQAGDQIDFEDEDGTPNIGTVSEIDPPVLHVVSTSDEPGVGGKRQEIGAVQVRRRNGQARPLLPAATDEELDQAVDEGRYGSQGATTLNDSSTPNTDENNDTPVPKPATADEDQGVPAPAETNTPPAEPEQDLPAKDDQVMTPDVEVPDAPDAPTDAAVAPERPEGAGISAAEPFTDDGDWRAAMVPVDAAEFQVRRAATRTWATDDTPGSVSLLGRAVLDALAAQEDNDHDEAEQRLVAARGHAIGLLATLEDDERGEMEGPLRDFLDTLDAYLARHRATRAKRQSEDGQRRDLEAEARAQFEEESRARRSRAAGPQPKAPEATGPASNVPDAAEAPQTPQREPEGEEEPVSLDAERVRSDLDALNDGSDDETDRGSPAPADTAEADNDLPPAGDRTVTPDAPAGSEPEPAAEGESIDPGQARLNDYVRVETQDTMGRPLVHEGYLSANARRGTAYHGEGNYDAWILYLGDGPNQTPDSYGKVEIPADQKIQRLPAPDAPEPGPVDVDSVKSGEYISVTLPDSEGNEITHEGYVTSMHPWRTGPRSDDPVRTWDVYLADTPHAGRVYDDRLSIPTGHIVDRKPAPGPVPELEIPDLPGIDLSEYTRNERENVDKYRNWAGVWANPDPDGPRNALLDRVRNMPGSAYKPLRPEEASRWIGTASSAFPLDQFDENTRHLLAQYDDDQREFLADQAAAMREATQEVAAGFRTEGRKIMLPHIATRSGMEKAAALLDARWSEDLERIRQVVPDRIAAAERADRHGLTEQQAKHFLTGVAGGEDPAQTANGITGAFPEVRRSLLAARSDVLAYYEGFRAWEGHDDDQPFAGYFHHNRRLSALDGEIVPAADPRTGAGQLIIGEAELPDGMRWTRLQNLQPGDFYRRVRSTDENRDVFGGMGAPHYVIHLHAEGHEGRPRTTSLDGSSSTERPGDRVIQLTAPEPGLRKKAGAMVRTDAFLKYTLPQDEKEWEAAQSRSRRPAGEAADLASLKEGERVRVRGSNEFIGGTYVAEGDLLEPPERAQMWRNGEQVDGWRLLMSSRRYPHDYIYVADGEDDEWAERASRDGTDTNGDNSSTTDLDTSEGRDGNDGAVEPERSVPTSEELKKYETGPGGVINEEGERALFGSPERMRALAAEGVNPTPVLSPDQDGQIWRDGRLIGTLFAPHLHTPGDDSPEGDWWSQAPWTVFSLKFASREAAIAHLVLRDKERGDPDLSVVHPDLAWVMENTAQSLGFPSQKKPFRGLETLPDNPADLERYYALRALLDELGRGVTPSGNVADDLAHLHDELRWLDTTHYKHQKPNLKDPYIQGPGWLADEIGGHLDVLRPEDPRALHHGASQDRAAHQFLAELLENGGMNNAEKVSIADVREGDIVELDGRMTGFYPGYTGRRLGYVMGVPAKATFKASGVRYKGYRVNLSEYPYESARTGGFTHTFLIPADGGTALRLAHADDVDLPFDQQHYGRQIGEGVTPDSNALEAEHQGSPPTTPATPNPSALDGDTDAARPADRTEPAPARSEGPSGARRPEEPALTSDATPETPATPEPVGGRPAEWVQVSDLQLGDVVRVDGVTKQGSARTLAGHVVDGPTLIPVTRKGRATEMYRVLIADSPDARSGSPVYVMPDAAAARATRDDADQFQDSQQTGADSDVLTGRMADNVPTDSRGNGLFPGSLVTDDNGKEGVVTGASANSVRVQFGDDRTDDDHAPTSVNVTDGGAARPTGWTSDGHRVDTGNVVGDRDGNLLGTVEDVEGDTATVATPTGMQDKPSSELRVLGDTAENDGPDLKVARVETVSQVDVGDVILGGPSRDRPVRVTGFGEHPTHGRPVMFVEDTTTGKPDWQPHQEGGNYTFYRLVSADDTAPDLGPEDAPDAGDEITSHEPAPAVDPITGPTVDPQLSPEERDAVTDRGQAPTSAPEAQQAAARIGNDLPVTPAQATVLAEELREGADPATPDGRAAQRAADHLDAAAGNEPDDVDQPEPGTVGAIGVGDTITLPDELDPDTMTAYRIVQIQEAPGGIRVLNVEDGDGMRFKRSLASSEPLYQLPEPEPPAAADDAEPRDPNPAPDADRVRADYADTVVRAVIDSALDGTTTPGSIHQLRQQIAERLTPEALRAAMRRARNGAMSAITDAAFEGQERDDLVQSLRQDAARARTDAVRAAVRTLDDLEPLDGESETDTANRAADLLRLIPEALHTRPAGGDDNTDGEASVNDDVTQHADDAVGEALQAAADSGELLTPERRAAIVQQLAARMASSRNDAAQRIASRLPVGQRAGLLPHIVAGLVAIARKIIAVVTAFLKALAKAWQTGREALRRMRERMARFRQGLMRRIRSWPETRRLRRLAAAGRLPQHADGLSLGDRVAHWSRLLPAPGRFGQVSRRTRWYQSASRSSLAAGQLPEVQDGVRWTMDRSVDGGPGPQALRHLAAVRAAGQDVDTDVVTRLSAAAPELGDDPHGTVRHAADHADIAERRQRALEAATAGGAPGADLEAAAARVEAQSARQEANRLQQAYAAALPGAVRGTLAEVREMGPGTTATLVTTPDSDPDAVAALRGITQFVPRDWLSPAEARFITAHDGDAGGYDPASQTATVADLGDAGRRTAAHALLTHLQQHYPDLLAAQEAFHFTRTHRGRVGARHRTSLDRLLARLFRNGTDQGESGDLVPLGLAALFSGDWYEDDDLRAFLLGLLATR